jgi:hypothetical protein
MTLHLHLDAATLADVVVEQLGDHSIFHPRIVGGARWLNTHCVQATWQGSSVVTWSAVALEQHLLDDGLVVKILSPQEAEKLKTVLPQLDPEMQAEALRAMGVYPVPPDHPVYQQHQTTLIVPAQSPIEEHHG